MPAAGAVESAGDEAAGQAQEVDSQPASDDDLLQEKLARKLDDMTGIPPEDRQKLEAAGMDSLGALLAQGLTRKTRAELAAESGVPADLILTWVNHIDLLRVQGIDSEYADLLAAAGVDTIPALGQSNPQVLHQQLLEANEAKTPTRKAPVLSQVIDWVEQAGRLPRYIQY
jgi:hypothetical protein